MKIAQKTECESLETGTIPTAPTKEKTTAIVSTIDKQQLQAASAQKTTTGTETLVAVVVGSNKNVVCNNNAAVATITKTKGSIGKMTDEQDNSFKEKVDKNKKNINNNICTTNNNKKIESIFADAANNLLKNGLNGSVVNNSPTILPAATSATISPLLSSTVELILPPSSEVVSAIPNSSAHFSAPHLPVSTPHLTLGNNNVDCESSLQQQKQRYQRTKVVSNGTTTLPKSSRATQFNQTTTQHATKTNPRTSAVATATAPGAAAAAMAAAAASATPPAAHLNANLSGTTSIGGGVADLGGGVKSDNGVIDYTISHTSSSSSPSSSTSSSSSVLSNNKSNQKFSTNNHCGSGNGSGVRNSCGDIGRHPLSVGSGNNNSNLLANCSSGYGGRLQFFKEGKVILELQRSKDGEKGGWVSVPRKVFRSPSAAATSATVTPTSASSIAYAKNESSTSLSFSDDNSSIQSSPWQRDHCWKQTAPRRGISKEMSLLYYRPQDVILSREGLRLALRKRRKPYDANFNNSITDGKSFVRISKATQSKVRDNVISNVNKSSYETKNGEVNCKSDGDISSSSSSSSLSSTATLVAADFTKSIDIDIIDKHEKEIGTENRTFDENPAAIDEPTSKVEKMSTSDDEDEKTSTVKIIKKEAEEKDENEEVNGTDPKMLVDDEMVKVQKNQKEIHTESEENHKTKSSNSEDLSTNKSVSKDKIVVGEKRLKKCIKTRTKLTTIIQKLIDSVPTRTILLPPTKGFPQLLLPPGGDVVNSVVQQNASSNNSSSNSNSLSYKISPPSTAASRLVEYHQQHVSPRKRILRQFEKVSLEDSVTGTNSKRSRSKVSSSCSSISNSGNTLHQSLQHHNSTKGSPSRNQQSNSPTSCVGSNGNQQLPHASGGNTKPKIMGIGTATIASTATSASTTATPTESAIAAARISTPPPPRLFSSYSIHSLLAGGSSSAASSRSSESCAKNANDAAIISSSLSYQQQQMYNDPSYLRSMLASPKSPLDGQSSSICGKSPSTSTCMKKRSPPYASPHENSSSHRTPPCGSIDYGRRSPRSAMPPEQLAGNKYTISSPNNFYSYLLAPKYAYSHPHSHSHSNLNPNPHQNVHATSSSSHASVISPATHTSRHASAFSSAPTHTIPLPVAGSGSVSSLSVSAANTYIPQVSVSAAATAVSPPRSCTSSPRECGTPRTVPKKTASIRRQFASPTSTTSVTTASASAPVSASVSAPASASAASAQSSSCPSPGERTSLSNSEEGSIYERKTSAGINAASAANAAAVTAHMLQRGSPLGMGTLPSIVSPLQYYMYPPSPASAVGSISPHQSLSVPGVQGVPPTVNPAAAVAAAAAYIPSMVSPSFFPYISTLAALRQNPWLHHYPGAVPTPTVLPQHAQHAPHPATASPTSRLSPPFHTFPPYNSAAVGVGPSAHHHMLAPAIIGLGAPSLHNTGASSGMPPLGPPTSPKSTENRADLSTTLRTSTATPSGTASAALFPSIKDELSSDLPLNLSKH